MCTECGLTEAHQPRESTERSPPTTYSRGRNKIDYIFISEELQHLILRRGYLPRKSSDHWGLYIDLNSELLIESYGMDPTERTTRKLTSPNPQRRDRYLDYIHKQFSEHKIYYRLECLEMHCEQQGCDKHARRRYQVLDKQITEIMLAAEEQCKQSNRPYLFSPILSQAGTRVIEAQRLLSRYQQNLLSADDDIKDDLNKAITTAKQELDQALQARKKARQQEKSLRDAHLDKCAEEAAVQHNIPKAAAIKQLKHREKSRRQDRKFKRFFRPQTTTQLDRLLVPDGDAWREESDPTNLYALLLKQTRTELGSAHGTPFTIAPYNNIIPAFETSPYLEDILQGNFETEPGTPSHITQLLTALQQDESIKMIDPTITAHEWEERIRIAKESTSSSPSGRHIGHYKTALWEPALSELHRRMINFAVQYNEPPDRWTVALQVRLEKEPGQPKIHRLRIIQLLEYDMNSYFGITIGRKMIYNAEDHNCFDEIPQYGIRPNKVYHDAALNTRLAYNICRQQRQTAAFIENDATKCYDRIIGGISTIATARLGVPFETNDLKLSILKKMRFYTKTATGISPSYTGNLDSLTTNPSPLKGTVRGLTSRPIFGHHYGAMQGSTDAGASWAAITIALFRALSITPGGLHFPNVQNSQIFRRQGNAFVDDTSLAVSQQSLDITQHENPASRVTSALQQLFAKWYRLLHTTGGDLAFHKCFWYGLFFLWKQGKPRLAQKNETPNTITIQPHPDQPPITIERVNPSEGRRTLGIRIAPDGSQTDEFDYRMKQAREYKQQIWHAPLSRYEARRAHNTIFLPRITASLPVACFSGKQCDKLQAAFQQSAMAKEGWNRRLP